MPRPQKRFAYEGPSEFRPKKILRDLKDPMILRATLTVGGETIVLDENHFSVGFHKPNDDILNVYHRYTYIDTKNEKMFGRWYDDVPLDTFRVLKDTTYTHMIPNYEDEDGNSIGIAKAVIEFTEDAINMLREAF